MHWNIQILNSIDELVMAFAAHGHNYNHGGQYSRHHGDDESNKNAKGSLSLLTVSKLLKVKSNAKQNLAKLADQPLQR